MADFFKHLEMDQNSGQAPNVLPITSDHVIPYDNATLEVHDPNVQNVWITDNTASYSITDGLKSDLYVSDDAVISIGDDFKISGKEFKLMLKMLLKMTKEKHPEEFI